MDNRDYTDAPIQRAPCDIVPRVSKGPVTHDYRVRGYGHDYTFDPGQGGLTAAMHGWGHGIVVGDRILLAHSKGGMDYVARYRVEAIRYFTDPDDMWTAEVSYDPGVPVMREEVNP